MTTSSTHLSSRAAAAVATVALAALLAGCTTPAAPTPDTGPEGEYEQLADIETNDDGLEVPPVLTVAEVLPTELVQGDHHEVTGTVPTDGFTNRYTVTSEFGDYEVDGTDRLRKRIHEINVMAALKAHQVSEGEVYALAAANAAEGPLEGAAQLLVHPIKTISGIPKGAWNYGRRVVEMTRGERTSVEDSYGAELSGFSEAKRQWAYRVGVDGYSRNEELQAELNDYAWSAFAGGLTVRIPMMLVPGAAGTVLSATNTAEDMKRRLRDEPPEQIRISNRESLVQMGADPDLAERLVGHPWYSPVEQLTIVSSLEELKDAENRAEFVQLAVLADDPDETYFYKRMALLLAAYHNNVEPISELIAPNGLILAVTAKNDVVVPLYIDYGVWSKSAVAFFDAVDQSLPADRQFTGKVFWLSGTVSPRVKQELGALGWEVKDHASRTYLVTHDKEMWTPGKPSEDRILPEIGG